MNSAMNAIHAANAAPATRPFVTPVLAGLLAAALASSLAPAQNTPPPPAPDGGRRGGATRSTAATTPAADDAAAVTAPQDPLNPNELKRYGVDRYDSIKEKSPFSFKIHRQEGPPPESFATDLALSGFSVDEGKGITYASIVDKKSNQRFTIRSDKPGADGIQLVQLKRQPGQPLLETSVLARKGNEEAEIKADRQVIERKAVVNAAVVGQQGQPVNVARGGPQSVNLASVDAAGNTVQGQVNANLQIQQGQQPQGRGRPQGQPGGQPAGLPPGAVAPRGGGAQGGATVIQGGANVARGGGAPPTAGDLAAGVNQPQAQPPQGRRQGQGQGQGQGQAPARRRVILPPTAPN